MGGIVSSRGRIHVHRDEENIRQRSRNNPYAYPPADEGSYFSTHYHLGHRKFETGEPELFLFGELNDINFLNRKPISFPYKQPGRSQPIRCLRSYINIHRDSVKLKKTEGASDLYTLEFMFDSDVNCQFTIYTRVPDTVELEALRNGSHSGEGVSASRSFHYSAGSAQEFKEEGFTIRPADFEDELTYDPENEHMSFPVVILMETDTPQAPENQQQAHLSICNLERSNGNGYSIKTFKQKLMVEGIEYLLQEIYGLENKAPDEEPEQRGGSGEDSDSDDDDGDDIEELGAECVICITDVRDTLLLPCRHLCLCAGCAANLRYQSSNCPVCRAPFRALLQIQALQPLDPNELIDDDEMTGNPKYSTPGFQCVPLLQALNGYKLEREDTGPEAGDLQPEDQPLPEQGVDATEEEPSSSPQTTEFCVVVPIEDSEYTPSSTAPVKSPIRTDMTKNHQKRDAEKECVVVDEMDIPLPGTPTHDHESEENRGSASYTSAKLGETIGQLALNLDVEPSQENVPDSPRSSESFSSRSSTKSTDVLLPKEK